MAGERLEGRGSAGAGGCGCGRGLGCGRGHVAAGSALWPVQNFKDPFLTSLVIRRN